MATSPITKICIACKKEKSIPDDFYVKEVREHSTRYHSRCKSCYNAYIHRPGPRGKRTIGLKKILSPQMLAERTSARRAVWNAVYRGTVVKPTSCQKCRTPTPKEALEAHHEDYSRKLDVEFVCSPCHRKIEFC